MFKKLSSEYKKISTERYDTSMYVHRSGEQSLQSQGNAKKSSNNFSRFGVPRPSKSGVSINLDNCFHLIIYSPVTGSQPTALEKKTQMYVALTEIHKYLRAKSRSTYESASYIA